MNVTGIPKTIDNDIAVCIKFLIDLLLIPVPVSRPSNLPFVLFQIIDRSFGFDTAVEEAQRAINAAHTEAESAQNGIGLVKLMGRHSGIVHILSLNAFIAYNFVSSYMSFKYDI